MEGSTRKVILRMIMKKIVAEGIPAVLWGGPSDKIYIYVHGKRVIKEYAEAFAKVRRRRVSTLSFEFTNMEPEDVAIMGEWLAKAM